MPEHRVRVVVTHLGGGFGGKCDFHFEAHIAALARAARRPVRLVLSRREEFVAPDKGRHAMVVDVATGRRRGRHDPGPRGADPPRLRARTRRDTPVLGQIAAMMIAGPVPHPRPRHRGAQRSTRTGRRRGRSGRRPGRRPAGPIEQHHDVARRPGRAGPARVPPAEPRRRRRRGPDPPAARGQRRARDASRPAVEPGRAGGPARAERGDRRRLGLVVQRAGAVRRLHPARRRRQRPDRDRRPGERDRRGHGPGDPRRRASSGCSPSDFAIAYQDTDAGPFDWGSSGSQTTFNNGRAVVEAAREVRRQLLELAAEALEASVDDLELADGHAGVRGSPDRRCTIAELASTAHDGALLLARGSRAAAGHAGAATRRRASAGSGSRRSPRRRSSATRPASGSTRRPASSACSRSSPATDFGRVLNPTGAEGQVTGGVVMALGNATLEGTVLRRRRPPAQPVAPRLQAAHDAPTRPTVEAIFVEHRPSNGGPRGSKGVGEPPIVPTAGAVANAIAAATGARVRRLPMTPERVWRAMTPARTGRPSERPFGPRRVAVGRTR